ncbi:MAG: FkbM family methyltransferase [Solirubrobacterales bacterium]|nr:FkbM family methyltransferase [Solirubrobacterales bacterium]
MPSPRLTTQDLKVWLTRFPRIYARARLPYATARFLMRRPHDIDYAAFGLFPQSDGLFLDIGANAGMSSMSLRIYQRQARILAIEPNPYHEPDLKWTQRVVRRMDYAIWAAGDVDGEADFYIPVYRGVPITAEASLNREFVQESPSLRNQLGARMHSPDFKIDHRRIAVRRMDDLHLTPAFVKIDVQGHEQAVLEGMATTLDRCSAPVLVEAPSAETAAFMASFGYRPYSYDHEGNRLVPLNGQPVTNVMFTRTVPSAG